MRPIPRVGSRLTALGLVLDGAAGGRPSGETDREVRHVGEPHLAQHVRGERGALAAGAVYDDAFRRVDLTRVVVRGRVEPEFEHAARHVRGGGDEPHLPSLADVTDVHHLHVASGDLGLDLLDGQILDPRLRFLDHLPDGFLRLPHESLPQSFIVAPPTRPGNALDAAKRPMSWRARSVTPYLARFSRPHHPQTPRW